MVAGYGCELAVVVGHRGAQGEVKVLQLLAPADELQDWSNFHWCFACEVLADIDGQRRDLAVVGDVEDGVRREAALVAQGPQVLGAQHDSAGVVAAHHGEAPEAVAGHGDRGGGRALLKRQVGEVRAARDQLLQHRGRRHDPLQAERLKRRDAAAAPGQVERPVGQAQAAQRGAPEELARRPGVAAPDVFAEDGRGLPEPAEGAEPAAGVVPVLQREVDLLGAGGGGGDDPGVEQPSRSSGGWRACSRRTRIGVVGPLEKIAPVTLLSKHTGRLLPRPRRSVLRSTRSTTGTPSQTRRHRRDSAVARVASSEGRWDRIRSSASSGRALRRSPCGCVAIFLCDDHLRCVPDDGSGRAATVTSF